MRFLRSLMLKHVLSDASATGRAINETSLATVGSAARQFSESLTKESHEQYGLCIHDLSVVGAPGVTRIEACSIDKLRGGSIWPNAHQARRDGNKIGWKNPSLMRVSKQYISYVQQAIVGGRPKATGPSTG